MKAVIRSRWFLASAPQPWELELYKDEHVIGCTQHADNLIWVYTAIEVAEEES